MTESADELTIAANLSVQRVYAASSLRPGYRVLVDRLWPRGISKETSSWDCWEKELAPSTPLRRWYHHDPERFDTFREQYQRELLLPERQTALNDLAAHAGSQRALILLTATRDLARSAALVLAYTLAPLVSSEQDERG
ncbi:DUF488 family protein [Ferrimicrobium sp.]|uniref:DUF488 domain-containing protein n=1 Tax=Ferrimicrobium sp. TaxID=2926050 RepID=UPI0026393AE1|nr:DUF488 family protein [Ferrimicrobium sp.]